ncbi:MAG: Gfo/Idh/MocA family oxidoreductase, partial [Bacteroidota bacterium]
MKRRDFVRTTGLSATTLAAGSPFLFTKRNPTSEVIRVGVIGTGSRGSGLTRTIKHIPALEVTACCDILPFRLEEGLQHTDAAKPYQDYRALLNDQQLDAVIIATPLYLHAQMAADAPDAGKHVYCEKTMVKGISNLQPVINKSNQKKDLVFQTGHQYHSSP